MSSPQPKSPSPAAARWLRWAQELQALAQTGLAYTKSPFDRERYDVVQRIAAEIVATHSGVEVDAVHAALVLNHGPATPKIDVRGVVVEGGKVLLVKERSDGCWTLPGGWADINESPAEAVVREVREESGFETRAVKLLALYDRNKHDHPPLLWHTYKVFFACEITGGGPSSSIETDGVDFFALEKLPELSTGRATAVQIRRFVAHHTNPDWPTEFD
jgi:ADP-ribose pyrophosphatase YjhB (NUDIX family)